jgi:hypothetical protein
VTAGAVYVLRNPLDVVLSVADHFGMSIDAAIDFLNSETTGSPTDEANVASVLSSWSAHVRSWADGGGEATHVMRFEDLLQNPAKSFRALVRFLGLERNEPRLRQAMRFSSFGELRRQERERGFRERSPNSKRFFRSGRKDQWRTALERGQVQRIVAAHGETMRRFGYLPGGTAA